MKKNIDSKDIAFELILFYVQVGYVSVIMQYQINSFIIFIVTIACNIDSLETRDYLDCIQNVMALELVA
jgi:hypothetical protein